VASDGVRRAEGWAPWVGAVAIAALLMTGGLLPGYAGVLDDTPRYRGPERTLFAHGEWPYLLALGLGLAGAAATAALYRRRPAWLAPALLTLTMVPAFALTTELADPPEYYRPYSRALGERNVGQDGFFPPPIDIEVGPGGWLTFFTLLSLAVGAPIWLGRSLDILARRRFAAGVLVLIVIASLVGHEIAEAAADDTCDSSPVDSTQVSPEWAFWLVVYQPAVLALVGLGAMSRRRFAAGALLLAAAGAAALGMLIIGVEIAGPCLA
jgi:hypothetical protein